MTDEHYSIDEKSRNVTYTDEGNEFLENLLQFEGLLPKEQSLYDPESTTIVHHINQGLRAHKLFTKDKDYIVRDNEVVLIDEFTGRMMAGRRLSDGLHQAIEAKEGVTIQGETQTLATITIQNYFRMYDKLAGMTGTAETEENEFYQIYGLDVMVIPTNRPVRRVDQHDQIFKTRREKYNAVIEEIAHHHQRGMPVLVGTVSVEVSETLSRMLKRRNIKHEVLNARQHQREAEIVQFAGQKGAVTIATNMAGRGIRHNVLNAKQHQREAEIVTEAGRAGSVTIATNMAGRGTDIKLGENVKQCRVCGIKAKMAPFGQTQEVADLAADEIKRRECDDDPPCGLVVIGTERHESRRIDRQLRGRSGRQGDPGASLFFLSLEDDLMRLFASDRIARIMEKTGAEEGEVITHPLVTRAIESAQKRVEFQNFQARKRLLEYDDVMNQQREVIYSLRFFALEGGEELKAEAVRMVEEALARVVEEEAAEQPEDWDREVLHSEVLMRYLISVPDIKDPERVPDADALTGLLRQAGDEAFHAKLQSWEELGRRHGAEHLAERVLSHIMLTVLDEKWKEHLFELDHLRSGIQYRAWGQKDPLIEYKKEAFEMFVDLMKDIRSTFTERFFKFQVQVDAGPPVRRPIPQAVQHAEKPEARAETDLLVPGAVPVGPPPEALRAGRGDGGEPEAARPQRRAVPKVGRNAPCPCGSGKKYKRCHGAG